MHVLCMVYAGSKTSMLHSWQLVCNIHVLVSRHATCILRATCMLYLHACCMHGDLRVIYMFWDIGHATCTLCATCMLCVMPPSACCMHVVYELLIHIGIFLALPYNYKKFYEKGLPCVMLRTPDCLATFRECGNESICSELVVLYPAS